MSETISGNFKTSQPEIEAVKDFLQQLGIDITHCQVDKFGQFEGKDTNARSAGDIYVKFEDKTFLLFEVKEEAIDRIKKYNELGIDFISAYKYKNEKRDNSEWIHPHNPIDYNRFIQSVDVNDDCFKWGKIGYSSSDVWIFYCKNEDGTYYFLDGYDYLKMKESYFFDYLKNNCQFVENAKPEDQLSNTDTWRSATFFVNRKDMERYKIKSIDDLYHNGNNFTNNAVYNGKTPPKPSKYDNYILDFGKYKGESITKVNDSYLKFIIDNNISKWIDIAQSVLNERNQANGQTT